MPARVVDASVLGALFFREERYQEAVRLASGNDWVAPTLLRYEMANIAVKKISDAPQQRETMVESLQAFLRLNIALREVDCQRVVELATLTGLTRL